jgi:hypothetical protein
VPIQDLARVARWMAGKAVGVVLSGGGSRGLAHLGVLNALDSAGVPIDVIGGTSQVPLLIFYSGVIANLMLICSACCTLSLHSMERTRLRHGLVVSGSIHGRAVRTRACMGRDALCDPKIRQADG